MKIVESFITHNPCYQSNVARVDSRYITFQNRGPLGLMLHSVGCSQPKAEVFLKSWNKETYTNASVHAFIDANNGYVYQAMPWNFRAWHCGGSGNNTHIGVEMCESAYIKYKPKSNKFEVLDWEKARADCKRAYKSAVELFAFLCEKYHLDPSTICSHKEGNKKGIATDHGDPEHYWRGLGMNYTMDGFRKDVRAQIVADKTPEKPKEEETEMKKTEIKEMIKDAIAEELGKYINDIKDIPHESVKAEMRELLDAEVINGGTPYGENPDDIYLPYNIVRALVIAKRYIDQKTEK